MSATGRGAKRRDADFYPTPSYCTELICREINWSMVDSWMEPCVGDGAIRDVVRKYRHPRARFHWCELSKGRDYLNARRKPSVVDLVLTNPPFSLAEEFIVRALSHSVTVVMLLPLNFLGSIKRVEFWKNNQPTHIFALAQRPSFIESGKTDSSDYGWFVWGQRGFERVMEKPPGIYTLMGDDDATIKSKRERKRRKSKGRTPAKAR